MNLLFSCIGRRGYLPDFFRKHLGPSDRVYGTSNGRLTPGFAHCDENHIMPDISSTEYPTAILTLVEQISADAILSCFDPDLEALAPLREEFLARGCLPVMPSTEVSGISFDKVRTAAFLEESGLPGPRTYSSLAEAKNALENSELSLPLMLKPRCGFGSAHLNRIDTPALLDAMADLVPDAVFQEMLPGQEYHLDIFVDREGEVRAVVPKEKLAMRAGETDQARTVDNETLIDLGIRLGRALGKKGHWGPLDVDAFLVGKQPYILEINPRFGGGYPISHKAGADFPGMVMKMIRGEPVPTVIGEYEVGITVLKEYAFLGGAGDAFLGPVTDHRT